MRLASGNAALTATSWGPIVKSCPEGPTRLDREIRVGVPARRADGSGRRTAGRWVAPPAVAAVRFSGLRVVERERSRARLGKATGVPRGADDPQGPNRPGAGGFARRPPGRGSWGLSFTGSGHPHRAPAPGSAAYQGGTRPAGSAVPGPRGPPARPRPRRSTCPQCWQSTGQSVVARGTAGSGPVLAHHGAVAPVRRELADRLPARRARRSGLEALTLL